jgi:adenine specific DNA methylase Mod
MPTAKAAHRNVVDERDYDADSNDQGSNRQKDGHLPGWFNHSETIGFSDCEHSTYEPGIVLDPFAGSGTTLEVARSLQCKSIGIEVKPEYCELIKKRLKQGVFQFSE